MAVAGAGQSMFAALAFSGASYLFKMLDGDNYGSEMARHNKALEELAEAKERFYENEVRQRDKIAKLKSDIKDAENDMSKVNNALDLLAKVRTIEYKNKRYNREPTLNDFYKPSKEMTDYKWLFSGMTGAVSGYLLHLII